MKQVKEFVKMFSPFNNRKNLPSFIFICKKMLAFFLLYFAAGVLGEAVIMGSLTVLGYDPLHGIMPEGKLGTLIPYYGFFLFLLLTLLYCKYVEKRTIKSVGFNSRVFDFLTGAGIAIILLVLIIGISCIWGSIVYIGTGEKMDFFWLIALMAGLMIQSTAEEVMCRGFLMTSLLEKIPIPAAVFFSSLAFALPHFGTLFEAGFLYVIIGIVNLFLISTSLSLLVLQHGNLWIACGLHSIWNFLLFGVCSMTLSGNEPDISGIFCFRIERADLWNGGMYGIEAGIFTTIILGLTVIVLLNGRKARRFTEKFKGRHSVRGGADTNGV